MSKRPSLRRSMAWLLVSTITVIVWAFGGWLIVDLRRSAQHSFEVGKESVCDVILANIVSGMEFDQKDYLLKIFSGLEKDADFCGARIVTPNGQLYLRHEMKGAPLPTVEATAATGPGGALLTVHRELHSEVQGHLGSLRVYFSRTALDNLFQTRLLELGAFFLLLTGFSALVLYAVVTRTVLRPIDALSLATRRISSGELSARAPVHRSDELGSLAVCFNAMAESVDCHVRQLEEGRNEILALQNLMNSVIQNSPNGVVTVDSSLRVVNMNTSATRLLGLAGPPAGGENLLELSPFFRQFQGAFDTVAGTRQVIRLDRQALPATGDRKTLDVIVYPIPFGLQEYRGVLLIDVTERVSLEKQLIQSQKMEAIGTLAGGIAHDFNNILTIIMGNISLLRLDIEEESVLERIQLIDDAVVRAVDLVKQILRFSRDDSGKKEHLDLREVLEEVLRMGREIFPRSLVFETKVEDVAYAMQGDRTQIAQVLMNILINARDAIEASGRTEPGLIAISLRQFFIDARILTPYRDLQPGPYAELRITDNGCGMSKTVMENIFNPFYTTKAKGKGTGLGLSIVYGIVKSHNGEVKAYSENGVGTTFTLLFPLWTGDAPAESLAAPRLYHGTGKILVVDDEEFIVKSTMELLEKLGYTPTGFLDGHEAIDYVRRHPDEVDLAILDIMMPRIDGYHTFLGIQESLPDLPVIFSSGYVEESLKGRLPHDARNVEFLPKPFNYFELSRVLHSLLGEVATPPPNS